MIYRLEKDLTSSLYHLLQRVCRWDYELDDKQKVWVQVAAVGPSWNRNSEKVHRAEPTAPTGRLLSRFSDCSPWCSSVVTFRAPCCCLVSPPSRSVLLPAPDSRNQVSRLSFQARVVWRQRLLSSLSRFHLHLHHLEQRLSDGDIPKWSEALNLGPVSVSEGNKLRFRVYDEAKLEL